MSLMVNQNENFLPCIKDSGSQETPTLFQLQSSLALKSPVTSLKTKN
jgi:hypothetical protein